MYGYVSEYDKTGIWDNATQIPKAISGDSNNVSIVESDNCWVKAPHQWRNQGCVAVSSENGTIGAPLNKDGGGVYVLEWDPVHGYIKSWIFKRSRDPGQFEGCNPNCRTESQISRPLQSQITGRDPTPILLLVPTLVVLQITFDPCDYFQFGLLWQSQWSKVCPGLP